MRLRPDEGGEQKIAVGPAARKELSCWFVLSNPSSLYRIPSARRTGGNLEKEVDKAADTSDNIIYRLCQAPILEAVQLIISGVLEIAHRLKITSASSPRKG